MPTPRDHARALRRRARTWFRAAGEPSRRPPRPGPAPEAVVARATRDLLRAESSEDVARIVANAVDVLGGGIVPARDEDPDALPLDISFGVSEPMLPTAPTGSQVHDDLERHLPALVADARQANDRILRTAHLSVDTATDPVTGLATRASFARELRRLRQHDAVAVVRVTVPEPEAGEDDRLEDAVREFASYLRAQLDPDDRAARVEEDEFALLLRQAGTAGVAVAVARLRRAWAAARPDVRLDVGVALFRDSDTATMREAYEALDRELASDDTPGSRGTTEGSTP